MLLSKLDITQGFTEWTRLPASLKKYYRNWQWRQECRIQSQSQHHHQQQHQQQQRLHHHYSYYHHHHRIESAADDNGDGGGDIPDADSSTNTIMSGHHRSPYDSDTGHIVRRKLSADDTIARRYTRKCASSTATHSSVTSTTAATTWSTILAIMTIFIATVHGHVANDGRNGAYNNYNNNNNTNQNTSNNDSDSLNSVYSNSNNNVMTSLAVDFDDDYYLLANSGASHFIQNLNKIRPQPIYQNEFALYIPKGADVADRIADKFGFTNMGQVSRF